MAVYLNSALSAAESYFNIHKNDNNLTHINKLVLGTTTKGAIFSVASFTHILAKATSTLLQNRVHSLKTYADQASRLSLRAIQSLNEPFTPEIQTIKPGCFRQQVKKETIKGPTLLNYLHNQATHIQAQLPLKKITILSGAIAASVMLYHYATINPVLTEVFTSTSKNLENTNPPSEFSKVFTPTPGNLENPDLTNDTDLKDWSIYAGATVAAHLAVAWIVKKDLLFNASRSDHVDIFMAYAFGKLKKLPFPFSEYEGSFLLAQFYFACMSSQFKFPNEILKGNFLNLSKKIHLDETYGIILFKSILSCLKEEFFSISKETQDSLHNLLTLLLDHIDSNNINEKSKAGSTMLHLAARYKNNFAIKELLKHNADINVKDIDNKTPLEVYTTKYFIGQESDEEIINKLTPQK